MKLSYLRTWLDFPSQVSAKRRRSDCCLRDSFVRQSSSFDFRTAGPTTSPPLPPFRPPSLFLFSFVGNFVDLPTAPALSMGERPGHSPTTTTPTSCPTSSVALADNVRSTSTPLQGVVGGPRRQGQASQADKIVSLGRQESRQHHQQQADRITLLKSTLYTSLEERGKRQSFRPSERWSNLCCVTIGC